MNISLRRRHPRNDFQSGREPFSVKDGFTLIELLIVIAVITILSIVVILVLNPTQLVEQSRDANRLSDMNTLNEAVGVYEAQGGSNLGSANTVYVSLPDPTATSTAGDQCQGLGLLSLPSGYTYQCAASSTYRATNGTGWIPINFSSIPAPPLGQLPIDPINTSSSREYYTYTTNGLQFEVTSGMESQKYQLSGSNDVISNDGGILATVYEKGTKFGLEPLDYGDSSLVGYWPLTEGTGSVAYDDSGTNATGSWNGTPAGMNGYYTPGKIGSWAGYFNGSNDYVNAGNSPTFKITANLTIIAWVNILASPFPNGATNWYIATTEGSSAGYMYRIDGGTGKQAFRTNGVDTCGTLSNTPLATSTWNQVAVVYAGTTATFYLNGLPNGTCLGDANPNSAVQNLYISNTFQEMTGLIDDVRIYHRALSAAQIAAMYSGGK